MPSFRALVLVTLSLVAQVAAAQNTPVRVRATITGFDGKVLAVRTREGEAIQIHLPDNVSVAAAKTITLADIKPGDFVGSATVKNAQGVLVARELHLFPAALRGVVSEGHTNWDLEPGSQMTNATLSAAPAQSAGGREITLNYKDGAQTILIPDGIPIFTGAQRAADGKITAARIQVSKDGARPAQ